jgi:predicted nucleotide-binding protein
MSFSLFLKELDELLNQVSGKVGRTSGAVPFGQDTVEHEQARLDELLEDLIDYSRAHGPGPLTTKLDALQPEDERHSYGQRVAPTELQARILRIQRALNTFGREALEAEDDHRASSQPLVTPFSTAPQTDPALVPEINERTQSSRVFVVHGHDDSALHQVSRLLEKLGLEPIVLREQPNRGKTIIEKFEAYSDVSFAVVLMTGDDLGASLADAELQKFAPRARQNVILELGYFVAKLSRERTVVLKSEGVEAPSDIMGVVYTEIDNAGAWRMTLGKELRACGYDIDLNKL